MLGIKTILAIVVCLLGINHGHNVMAHALSFHTGHPKQYRVLTAVRKKDEQSNLPQLLYFQNKKIWIVGDSLMVGRDGTKLLKENCPKFISQVSHARVNNDYSFSGAQISGNQQMRTFDLTNNVSKIILDPQFQSADILLLSLGVNDLNYSDNNIGYVQQRLQTNIMRLHSANLNVKIMGLLPFESYMKDKRSYYRLAELRMALTEVYQSFGIPVLNWRQAGFSYDYFSIKDGVHPNSMTYKLMSTTIVNFMVLNRSVMPLDISNQSLFVSNGWQTNEQGQRQYAKNNILLTDWQIIDQTAYYFDPITKALK
ncbi:SGNH/GDSL hydrolase family protein [Weissella fangxianensis]|uniref:SGNH/GDSL hydrolase family protein n=1 Tax=Weissella fangxianensis TaxID=2953879 RepID=UPI0021578AC0|nr:SGNH/GDSL hydrolase family protein [Weissella fangxianensis]